MKIFLPILIGLFSLLQINNLSAQIRYSLDSIFNYTDNGRLELKEIVTLKDTEGNRLKSNIYRNRISTGEMFSGKTEYVYFSDKSIKSFKSYDYFPNKDTFLLTDEFEMNDFGEQTAFMKRILGVTDLPNFFEVFNVETKIDTTILDSDGRVLSKFKFEVDPNNQITYKSKVDNFFAKGAKRDSSYTYILDGNDLKLAGRFYYNYTPSGMLASIRRDDSSLSEYSWELIKGKERLTSITRKSISDTDTILNYKETYLYNDFFHSVTKANYQNGNITFKTIDDFFLLNDMETVDSSTNFIVLNNGDLSQLESKKYFYSNISSTSNYTQSKEFILSPNPCQDYFEVKSDSENLQNQLNFKIIDVLGNLKITDTYSNNLVDVSTLPPGIYYFILDNIAVKPFVIQQ